MSIPDKIPFVGIGCIVVRNGELLLVRNRRGFWSTPGGHLDFGETPEACAARETIEETGVGITNVEFVAVTYDVMPESEYSTTRQTSAPTPSFAAARR